MKSNQDSNQDSYKNSYQNIFKWLILLSLGFILCISTVAYTGIIPTSKQISPSELAERIETNTAPIILDVRTAKEYSEGHIPRAINIEYIELPSRIDEVYSLRKKQIVVYCERGIRAAIAEKTLKNAGFEEILHLEGDMNTWRNKRLKISHSK